MALFDFFWNDEWTKTTKPLDRDRPFHRIDSPSFDETAGARNQHAGRPPADGRGYDCGCRSPLIDYDVTTAEIFAGILLNIVGALPTAIMKQLMRAAPSWVPVERRNVPASQFRNFREVEKEVEGVLFRSFQTWTDVPLLQWHAWYDWNFHLVPAKGYKFLRGLGNDPAPGDTGPDAPFEPVGHPLSMECEWDCGALGADVAGPLLQGPMFVNDWAWPQASQYVWMAGRWIYDCGHATSDEKTGPRAGLMRTEIHPCKAIATARREAFDFEENEGAFVPAIQFMFFASRLGGYKEFPAIDDVDYEFIVDLPPIDPAPMEWPIGHTPEFPLNTVVLRPRLLHHFNYEAFQNAAGRRATRGQADPEIEILPPKGPSGVPDQVKVKIPLTKLKGSDRQSYGVIVSLGWFDPDGSQAAKVKKVTVSLSHVQTHEETHEGFLRGNGEWTVKVAVNGRWRSVRDENVGTNDTIRLDKTFDIHLAEDDVVNISAHGMEEDDVGEFMNKPGSDRVLNIFLFGDRRRAIWDDDVDQPDDELSSVVAREIVAKMLTTWSVQNEPLGMIDPGHPLFITDTPNPIQVKDVIARAGGLNRDLTGKLTACLTKELGESAELAFDRNTRDYTLHYKIRVADQAPRRSA